MRSTFSVLFYTKNQSLKDGRVPIMGRITINRTTACFSCKLEVSLALWDAKANRAKGKSDEARRLNQKLDHIKAQITRHYQYICDHDSLVTAKSVYNRLPLTRKRWARKRRQVPIAGWWQTTTIYCFSSKRRGVSRI